MSNLIHIRSGSILEQETLYYKKYRMVEIYADEKTGELVYKKWPKPQWLGWFLRLFKTDTLYILQESWDRYPFTPPEPKDD